MSEHSTDSLGVATLQRIAEVAREVADQPTEREALSRMTRAAATLIEGAGASSITVRQPTGKFETVVASSEDADRADRLQYAEGAGPSVAAVAQDEPVIAGDLSTDDRWGALGARAAKAGTRSVLSLRLGLNDDTRAHALTIYSPRPHAFGAGELLAVWQFSAQASVAVRTARGTELATNLQRALQTNRDIGVAVGVLMCRRSVPRDGAYDMLRTASQRSQRKLAEIAAEVVETGALDAALS